jgi:hypothetical protein
VASLTRVVNLRCEPFTRYIGRASRGRDGTFGNPFAMHGEADRPKVISDFRGYFYKRLQDDPEFKAKVETLRGETLGCFCKPKACHGDVYVEYFENNPKEENI